ncbi:MAG TPA: EcsC family protein [Pelomicrobium sp.]|nr:EcsC family protein [Pelomicrobium sp.]
MRAGPGEAAAPATTAQFSVRDAADLRRAVALLECPGLAIRLADLLGKPREAGMRRLPAGWQARAAQASRVALEKALDLALKSLKPGSRASRDGLQRLLAAGSGAAGGALGLPALAVELPLSTALILRSIAEIAAAEGHDLTETEVRLQCLTVFALGGRARGDDAAETGYWAMRATLASAVTDAARHLAVRRVADARAAPPIARLLLKIAQRFQVPVAQQFAAKAVPVVGAVAGAGINLMFMQHFQDMARGHFILRRLEASHGEAAVRAAYLAAARGRRRR